MKLLLTDGEGEEISTICHNSIPGLFYTVTYYNRLTRDMGNVYLGDLRRYENATRARLFVRPTKDQSAKWIEVT